MLRVSVLHRIRNHQRHYPYDSDADFQPTSPRSTDNPHKSTPSSPSPHSVPSTPSTPSSPTQDSTSFARRVVGSEPTGLLIHSERREGAESSKTKSCIELWSPLRPERYISVFKTSSLNIVGASLSDQHLGAESSRPQWAAFTVVRTVARNTAPVYESHVAELIYSSSNSNDNRPSDEFALTSGRHFINHNKKQEGKVELQRIQFLATASKRTTWYLYLREGREDSAAELYSVSNVKVSEPQYRGLIADKFIWAEFNASKQLLYFLTYRTAKDVVSNDLYFRCFSFLDKAEKGYSIQSILFEKDEKDIVVEFDIFLQFHIPRAPTMYLNQWFDMSRFKSEPYLQTVHLRSGTICLCYQHPITHSFIEVSVYLIQNKARISLTIPLNTIIASSESEKECTDSASENSTLSQKSSTTSGPTNNTNNTNASNNINNTNTNTNNTNTNNTNNTNTNNTNNTANTNNTTNINNPSSPTNDSSRVFFGALGDMLLIYLPGHYIHFVDCAHDTSVYPTSPFTGEVFVPWAPFDSNAMPYLVPFDSLPSSSAQSSSQNLLPDIRGHCFFDLVSGVSYEYTFNREMIWKIYDMNLTDKDLYNQLLHVAMVHLQDEELVAKIVSHVCTTSPKKASPQFFQEFLLGSAFQEILTTIRARTELPLEKSFPLTTCDSINFTMSNRFDLAHDKFQEKAQRKIKVKNISYSPIANAIKSNREERLILGDSPLGRRISSIHQISSGPPSKSPPGVKRFFRDLLGLDDSTVRIEEEEGQKEESSFKEIIREGLLHSLSITYPKEKNYAHTLAHTYCDILMNQSTKLLNFLTAESRHNRQQTATTFRLLENFYACMEEFNLPFPKGFFPVFTDYGYHCLQRSVFLQYLEQGIFAVDERLVLKICRSLKPFVEEDELFKYHLISKLPHQFEELLSEHPTSPSSRPDPCLNILRQTSQNSSSFAQYLVGAFGELTHGNTEDENAERQLLTSPFIPVHEFFSRLRMRHPSDLHTVRNSTFYQLNKTLGLRFELNSSPARRSNDRLNDNFNTGGNAPIRRSNSVLSNSSSSNNNNSINNGASAQSTPLGRSWSRSSLTSSSRSSFDEEGIKARKDLSEDFF